jgi:predicted ATP-dependent endonuclease of OLD family
MLKSVTIEGFKGFQISKTINFELPNGNLGSGLNIIVGSNNSGKTTIFDALKKFHSKPIFNDDEIQSNTDPKITITDENNQSYTLEPLPGSGLAQFTKQEYFTRDSLFFLSSIRDWSDQGSPNTYQPYNLELDQKQDNAFIGVLQDVEKNPDLKTKFIDLIKKVVPHFQTYNVRYTNNQAYIRYTTGNQIDHKAGTLGQGVLGIFKLLAPLLYLNDQFKTVLIDEPENSLHPQAQKNLLDIYAEFAKNYQIIIITHSPIFIDWNILKEGGKIIRIDKRNDKDCEVFSLDKKSSSKLVELAIKDSQKPYLFDNLGKEVFFAENVLLVEGQNDPQKYKEFITQNNIETNFQIFGYGCGGSGSMANFLEMFQNQLGLKVACLFDSPNKKNGDINQRVQDNINKCKQICPDGVFCQPFYDALEISKKDKVKKQEMLKVFENINDYFVKS